MKKHKKSWFQKPIPIVVLLASVISGSLVIALTQLPAQSSPPAVPCTDSDGGVNLEVKGTTVGTPWDAQWNPGINYIYGQEPDPTSPKKTTDNFTTHYDYCGSETQLNEGECNAEGKVAAYGRGCTYGCSNGACKPPPDTPPSITLSVQATTPTTWRPGGRGYYTASISDDKGLKNVIVTTSQMMHSSSPIDMSYQCAGKTSCEEKVYTIVPSNPGAQFVTVTATDTAGQISTKTVNFDAPACAASTDCGSSDIQWAGASYCEKNGSIENRISQYGVAASCESGICNTASLPRLKQQCQGTQVCTFDASGNTLCIEQPKACSPNAQVTSACMCVGTALNYPVDWRARNPTYCCADGMGSFTTMSPGPCPDPSVRTTSEPSVSTGTAWVPATAVRTTGESSVSTGTAWVPSTVVIPQVVPSPSVTATSSASTVVPRDPMPVRVTSPVEAEKEVASKGDQHKESTKEKRNNKELKKKWTSLKSKMNLGKKKVASVEKSIASLEKKVDGKLKLLDRTKSAAVQKRINVQIDRLQEKIDTLEGKKEKLEAAIGELEETMGELRALIAEED